MLIDFSTDEKDYTIADEGQQKLMLNNVYPKISKNNRPMIVFVFVAKNDSKIFHYCINEDNNRWKLKEVLSALLKKDLPSGKVEVGNLEDLIGREIMADIEHKEWGTSINAVIKSFLPYKKIDEEMDLDIEIASTDQTPF